MDCSPPGSSAHGDSPGKNAGVDCHALLQESTQPRDRTQVSRITGDSLPADLPGKPLESTLIQCDHVLIKRGNLNTEADIHKGR